MQAIYQRQDDFNSKAGWYDLPEIVEKLSKHDYQRSDGYFIDIYHDRNIRDKILDIGYIMVIKVIENSTFTFQYASNTKSKLPSYEEELGT